jgi:hypothetical protein
MESSTKSSSCPNHDHENKNHYMLGRVAAAVQQVGWPLAKLTVHVVGEQGEPIPGADVTISFREKMSDRNAWAVGKTDTEGNFTAEGHSDKRLSGFVRKAGYYEGGTGWVIFKDPALGKWEPWDSVAEVALRPIGKPVALYAKTDWIEIPGVEQAYSYDLVKSDWVAPHGSGLHADVLFTLQRRYENRDDFEVKIRLSFSQRFDGIQEAQLPAIGRNSAFRWLRQAPAEGYQSVMDTRLGHDPKAGFTQSASEEQAYFFRVRTVEENGRIVSALYGKIKGGLQLAPSNSATCKLKLTYYLNPTPLDRNLEWDPKHNLLQGLSHEQAPTTP